MYVFFCLSVASLYIFVFRTLLLYVFSFLYSSIFAEDIPWQPQALIPIHPIHNVQDWDAPEGAIAWDHLINFLKDVKKKGVIPPDHTSRDHLNEYKEIKVDEEISEKWVKEFEQLKAGNTSGEKVIWALIDGFLIYWHKVR